MWQIIRGLAAGGVTIFLTVYLVYALIRPERF